MRCSEALLYKHFEDKTRIFLAVLQERSPALGGVLIGLGDRVGTGTVAEHLQAAATSAVAFYFETFPMAAGIFADHRLLSSHRDAVTRLDAGPALVNNLLTDYLRAEQRLGRITAHVDAEAVATLLLGGCLQQAFLANFAGGPAPNDDTAAGLARTLSDSIVTCR